MSTENIKVLTDTEVLEVSGGGTNDWLGKGFNLKVGQHFRTKKSHAHDIKDAWANHKGSCTSSEYIVCIDCYALGYVEASCALCDTKLFKFMYSEIINPNE